MMINRENTHTIPFHFISGLRPRAWLSVGAGFSREDLKTLLLSQGRGFVAEAMITPMELCHKLTGIRSDRVLSSQSRQEVLRVLMSESRIMSHLNELKRIRRQRNFLRRLDTAIQSGRLTFAHPQEEEVFEERLKQLMGESPVRSELRALAGAYEAWLQASGWYDPPLLMRQAIEVLKEGWPSGLMRPQVIFSLSVQTPESLEKEFWDHMKLHVDVQTLSDLRAESQSPQQVQWQKWHTLDDAAEFLVDEIEKSLGDQDWNHHAILIPDIPSVRRSLRRALDAKGLPLAEPRDPTRLRWDELLKTAVLPLEVVGKNFERNRVIAWLRSYMMQDEFSAWINEINARGIRNGMSSYDGGLLSAVHSRLLELNQQFGGRKKCEELAENHLKLLRSFYSDRDECSWIISFFEQTWKAFSEDVTRVGLGDRKAPMRFWLERLQSRLSEASPPIDRLKPQEGVRIYRLQQAPVFSANHVWIFGLPSQWLRGEGSGDYWFSEREREILSSEFAVRSWIQVREERIQILKSWFQGSEKVVIMDSQYSEDGRERESLLPILKELEISLGLDISLEPQEMGSHPRFTPSYGAIRPVQPQELILPPLPLGPGGVGPELTATTIDRYSRCAFQALGYHRWNLKDVREPDAELWPDVKGTILHEAVRILISSLSPQGTFTVLPAQAIESAWKRYRPKGLLKSPRIEKYVKSRMVTVLEAFCEKEREYLSRTDARSIVLDDYPLRLQFKGFSIIGKPDRIDLVPEGLFVVDYKSSGTVPHGSDMIEMGYRLQLPFYALAAQRRFEKTVIGAQFVEFDKRGSRKSGIFFKQYNGKEPGKVTAVRGNSKSLITASPDDVWSQMEEHILAQASSYIRGHFRARPNVTRREKECGTCRLSDLCGYRRRVGTGLHEQEGSES